jgi:hypothetical protein
MTPICSFRPCFRLLMISHLMRFLNSRLQYLLTSENAPQQVCQPIVGFVEPKSKC